MSGGMKLEWHGGKRFLAEGTKGGRILIDTEGVLGPKPFELKPISAAACSSADILDVLGEQGLKVDSLTCNIRSIHAPKQPWRITRIELNFVASGNFGLDDLKNAVVKSQGELCTVVHSLRESVEVRTAVELIDTGSGAKAAIGSN